MARRTKGFAGKKRLWLLLAFLLAGCLWGCDSGAKEKEASQNVENTGETETPSDDDASALFRSHMEDETVSEVTVSEDITLSEPVVVSGVKVLTGEGTISGTEGFSGDYLLELAAGAELTLEESVVFIGNAGIGGIYVGENASLIQRAGKIETAMTGVYVAGGGSYTFEGGALKEAAEYAVYVEEKAELHITSNDAKIVTSSNYGIWLDGDGVIDGVVISTGGNNQITVNYAGTLALNGGSIAYGKGNNISNRGTMTIDGATIMGAGYCGIVNTGKLEILSASIAENGTCGVMNKNGGDARLVGEEINIYNNKIGIMNEELAECEVGYANIHDHTANNISNFGYCHAYELELENSVDNSVNNRYGGYILLEDSVIDGTGKYHGLYNVAGAKAEFVNVTIKNTASRGIQNRDGEFIGKNVTIENTGGVGLASTEGTRGDAAGDITIDGLKISNVGSTNSILLDGDAAGHVVIKNATLDKTPSNNVRVYSGYLELMDSDVLGNQSTAANDRHGIAVDGGTVKLTNVTIRDTTGRGLQNKGGTVTGRNVTFHNTASAAVGNKVNDDGRTCGTIAINGLYVINPSSHSIINECAGTITVNGGSLARTCDVNVRVKEGTVNLSNLTINGAYRGRVASGAHAVYVTEAKLNITDCVICNVEGDRAVQNRGSEVHIDGLRVYDCGGAAICNAAGDSSWAGEGTMYISGLVTDNTCQSNAVINETEGYVEISDSKLTVKNTNTAVVNRGGGTLTVKEGTEIYGNGRGINNSAILYVQGGSIYQNGYDADQSGTGIYNTGTLYLQGGAVYDNYTTKTGAINNNEEGVMYMTGGAVYGNTAVDNGGGIHISSKAQATLTGGYAYGNRSQKNGQDIYNNGKLTIGEIVVGYDANGNYQGGELYFTAGKNPVLQGTRVWHTAEKPMILNSPSLGFGSYLVNCSDEAAAAGVAQCFAAPSANSKYQIMAVGSDVRLYLVGATAVCRIGTQEFVTLQDAIDSVAENQSAVITMISSFAQDTTVTIDGDKAITITDDGTVRTITRSEDFTTGRIFSVREGSHLTLQGSSGTDETPMLVVDGNKEAVRANLGSDAQIAYVAAGGVLTVREGTVLKNNLAKNVGGAATVYGTMTIEGGLFENNESTSSNGGGALNVENGGFIYIYGGTFKENKATHTSGHAGALRIVYGGTVVIKDAVFTGNSANGHGGAIYTLSDSGDRRSSLTIENTTFTGNTAGKDAGAVFVNNMQNTVTITKSVFTGNEAGEYGGAMECKSQNDIRVISSTFTDNTSGSGGASITVPTGYAVSLENCTLTHTGEAYRGDLRLGGAGSIAKLGGRMVIDEVYLGHNGQSCVQVEGTLDSDSSIGITPVRELGTVVVRCGSADDAASILNAGIFRLTISDFELAANGSNLQLKAAEESGEVGSVVARIRENNTEYGTLNAAVSAANGMASATIELLDDVELSSSLTISGNVTIIDDGTARTITRSSGWTSSLSPNYNRMFYIADGGSLILAGSSGMDDVIRLTLDGGNATSRSNGQIVAVGNAKGSTAEFILNAGVKLTNNNCGSAGGAITVWGTMTMNGGVITGNSATGTGGAINIQPPVEFAGSSSLFAMNGGTITGNTSTNSTGAGGVNVSTAAAMVMTGGMVSGNTAASQANNSIRLGGATTVFRMSGTAYTDHVRLGVADSTCAIELAGNLTTGKTIVISLQQDPEVDRVVLKEGAYTESNLSKFNLHEGISAEYEIGLAGESGSRSGVIAVKTGGAAVAYLGTRESGAPYATLAAAVAAANEAGGTQTVTLAADTTVSSPITVSCDLTITDDGTARTITRSAGWTAGSADYTYNRMFYIDEGASLTLTGSSASDGEITLTLDGGGTSALSNGQIVAVGSKTASTAEFTMNAGVRLTNNNNSNAGGAVTVYGVMTMNGGVIDDCTSAGTGGAINIQNPGTSYIGTRGMMTMNGGEITGNTSTDTSANGCGGVNVSTSCTLIMTGGTIAGNTTVDAQGNNSVRLGGATTVLQMSGFAYVDHVRLGNSADTCAIGLAGNLTTEEAILISLQQDPAVGRVLIKEGSYAVGNYEKFALVETLGLFTISCEGQEAVLAVNTENMEHLTAVGVSDGEPFIHRSTSSSYNVQGGCSDGEYIYLAIEMPQYEESWTSWKDGTCYIIKIDPETWTEVGRSETLATDHSNDITYNSKTGELLVVHCYGEIYRITAIDPDTLAVTRTIEVSSEEISEGIYGLDYIAATDRYVAGIKTTYDLAILDSDFGLVSEFSSLAGFTKQSLYSDDNTIYVSRSYSGGNVIICYDWNGNHTKTYIIDGTSEEGECLFEYDGKFYMAFIPSGGYGAKIYRLEGLEGPEEISYNYTIQGISGGYDTLEAAVAAANAMDSAMIELHTDTQLSSSLTISGDVTIIDDGTARTITRSAEWTSSAGPNYNRMFYIDEGGSLTLAGSTGTDDAITLTLDGGSATSRSDGQIVAVGNAQGSTAAFTLNAGVKLTNNNCSSGGGALTVYGTMTMNGGVITGNTATGTGGAVNIQPAGDYIGKASLLYMNGGTITGNTSINASGAGGVNVSTGATMVMTGGTVSGNTAASQANNSIRLGGATTVFRMSGAAYTDHVRLGSANSTCAIELAGNLTTGESIVISLQQDPPVVDRVVLKEGAYTEGNLSKFNLHEGISAEYEIGLAEGAGGYGAVIKAKAANLALNPAVRFSVVRLCVEQIELQRL